MLSLSGLVSNVLFKVLSLWVLSETVASTGCEQEAKHLMVLRKQKLIKDKSLLNVNV